MHFRELQREQVTTAASTPEHYHGPGVQLLFGYKRSLEMGFYLKILKLFEMLKIFVLFQNENV